MSGTAKPRKILLIVVDALRADHLGCYGYRRKTSPHLDAFAGQSFLFQSAFSACSYTVPSHASMLTGKYPSRTTFGFSNGWPIVYDANQEIMLQEVLSSTGYETAAFVSAMPLRKHVGISSGFKVYDDHFTRGEPNRQNELWRNCEQTNQSVFGWLDEHKDGEFFLFIHYFDVHGPYVNPEGFREIFKEDPYYGKEIQLEVKPDDYPWRGIPAYQVLKSVRDENGNLLSYERDVRYYVSEYDAGIKYCDHHIGKLFEKLKDCGIYDECLIFVTSDHGEAMGENNVWFYHGLTVTPEQIHVPLIVKPHTGWKIKPHALDSPVSTVDLCPTILSLCRYDYSSLNFAGYSLKDRIGGKEDEVLSRRTVFSETERQAARVTPDLILEITKKTAPERTSYPFIGELVDALHGKKIRLGTKTSFPVDPLQQISEDLGKEDARIKHLERKSQEYEAEIKHLSDRVRGLVKKLSERNSRLYMLMDTIEEREASLDLIYHSHGWKALLLFYRWRDRLLPPRSRRKAAVQILAKILLRPGAFFKHPSGTNLHPPRPSLSEREADKNIAGLSEEARVQQVGKGAGGASKAQRTSIEDPSTLSIEVSEAHARMPEAPGKTAKTKLIAFYLPQFHSIPENDRWWGKGFTEWQSVANTRPLFPNHYQPHIPADLGFYDLRSPEARQAQAEMAAAYGIYGFCYYHYWFNGKRLLHFPFDQVLTSHQPDFPFCLCWANEDWTKAWDGRSGEILIKQEYSPEDDLQHIRYLIDVFGDRRYMRIAGKPLFLVYRANKMPNPLKTTDLWREEANRLGIGGLFLCRVESFPDEHTDPRRMGFDASVEFQPDWTNLGTALRRDKRLHLSVYEYEDVVERMLKKEKPPYRYFRCVTPSWDNSPRRKSGAVILKNSTPVLYETWLRKTIEKTEAEGEEEKIVFINAMNEWGEGCHLEPDLKHGRAYLEATRHTLAGRNGPSPVTRDKDKPVPVEGNAHYKKLHFPKVEQPFISILIPVCNRWEFTYRCLSAIIENSGDFQYEIILADDASTDETARASDYSENIKVIRNQENFGFLRNVNRAAQDAAGKYLVILNNDTVPERGWLKHLIELIDRDDRIGLVGSKLLFPDRRLQEAGGMIWGDGGASHYGRGEDPNKPEYNYVKEVDYVSGACMMIRTALWRQLGGFDTRFAPAYYEDVDLAFQVRKEGLKVMYQPRSVVIHFESVSDGADREKGSGRYQRINGNKFLEKWKDVLDANQSPRFQEVFHARDRSKGKKTILVVEHSVPDFDKHAGSRTTLQYLKLFLGLDLNVKFIDDNFINFGVKNERYTAFLEQLGIEVLSHEWYRRNWKQWVREQARYIDYVHLNRPISIAYIDILKRKTKAKILYNCIDFHYLRERRQYELSKDKDLLRLSKEHQKQEFYLFKKSDVILTYSEYEKSILDRELPGKKVQVIPLYVYDEPFPLGIDAPFEKRTGLMFVGGFAHEPNVDGITWFVKDIFPRILERSPEMSLSIIGSNLSGEIERMRSRNIEPVGHVSDGKLRELYSNTRIVIVPLRFGAGVKGKVIEAIAHGVPVVTTDIGREGIESADGTLSIANEPDEFAGNVLDLYADKQKWTEMRQRQIEYARRYFDLRYAENLIRGVLEGQVSDRL